MADIIDVMIADTYHYTETGKNIAGRMRQWKPVNLTKELKDRGITNYSLIEYDNEDLI